MPQHELFEWVEKVSTEFYELVYNDLWFKKIFRNVDQDFITSQQTDFMIQNFGGPKKFSGRGPNEAHPHIWVDEDIWNYREMLLKQAFENLKAPNELRERWLKIDEAFKAGIINTSGVEQCSPRYAIDDIIYEPMPEYLKKKVA